MKEVQTIAYMSEDGKVFSTKEACLQHEELILTAMSAFQKIQFCDSKNTIINYPIEKFVKFYLDDGEGEDEYDVDLAKTYIIRISKSITDKEILILNQFFSMYEIYVNSSVPSILYAGATYFWDENEYDWKDTQDVLKEITKEYNRIKDLERYLK